MGVSAILTSNGCMCLGAGGFKMLDISKYVAAGTSLQHYLKAYLGKCQCAVKLLENMLLDATPSSAAAAAGGDARSTIMAADG